MRVNEKEERVRVKRRKERERPAEERYERECSEDGS
jgi:hypothetical protein